MDEKKSSGDLTLEEIIVEIRHELEEDQLFLQEHYRLWEAGDRESAVVDERFRHVLLLTSIMDELLSSFLTEEKESLRQFLYRRTVSWFRQALGRRRKSLYREKPERRKFPRMRKKIR